MVYFSQSFGISFGLSTHSVWGNLIVAKMIFVQNRPRNAEKRFCQERGVSHTPLEVCEKCLDRVPFLV